MIKIGKHWLSTNSNEMTQNECVVFCEEFDDIILKDKAEDMNLY